MNDEQTKATFQYYALCLAGIAYEATLTWYALDKRFWTTLLVLIVVFFLRGWADRVFRRRTQRAFADQLKQDGLTVVGAGPWDVLVAFAKRGKK